MSHTRPFQNRFKGVLMLAAAATAMISTPAFAQYSPNWDPRFVPTVATTPPSREAPDASIADVVERVTPAVVNIVVTSSSGEVTSLGQGSGFVISPIGEVVTNYHVIEGGDAISVIFKNGNTFDAQVVGTDEETDLALLKINSPQPFPHVNFYKGKKVRIGDWVIAIGNPYGIGQSTSLGIISAIGRDRVESGAYVDYIQTDATINQGNSGGPLFNPQGLVIGVNSAIFSPTGASVGIGFSIPHETAEEVIYALRKDGRVRRGYLGAGLRTAEFSYGDSSPFNSGAIVNNIVPGSPAHLHGLMVDDVILQMNGEPVTDSVDATRAIGKFMPGQTVNFLIERGEQKQNVPVRIVERPSKTDVERAMAGGSISGPVNTGRAAPSNPAPQPYSPGASSSETGMSLVDLSAQFRRAIGMRADQVGVYVERVNAGSAAEARGLKSNMVLLEANRKPIASVSAFGDIFRNAKRAGLSNIQLRVRQESGGETYITLPI